MARYLLLGRKKKMKNDDELMTAEEFFGVKEIKDVRPRGARPRCAKKSAQDPLAEIKVKMVMRIYHVSCKRAKAIIAGRAAEKDALDAKKTPRNRVRISRHVCDDDDELL